MSACQVVNLLHGSVMLPDPVEGLHLAHRLLGHAPLRDPVKGLHLAHGSIE